MKKILLAHLLALFISPSILPGQLRPLARPLDLVESITPQRSDKKKKKEIYLSHEILTLIDYAKTAYDPMVRDYAVDQFIDRYYPRFKQFLMRNGDIAYLKFYYEKYLMTLEECNVMRAEQPLDFGSTRSQFFKNANLSTRKEKRLFWRMFSKKRDELVERFFKFNQYIIPAISTEVAMMSQENHFPELTEAMNKLVNLDGTPMEVMIFSNYQIQVPDYKNSKIAGLSIIALCDNIFTSGSPNVRRIYPGLRGNNKGLTVHLKLFEGGVTLSHELGHLYYLYYKWDEYVEYIKRKGKDYEPGGHGPGDPSGEAAWMTENGILPFEIPKTHKPTFSTLKTFKSGKED